MTQDQLQTQNTNQANKIILDAREISEIQPNTAFEYLDTTERGLSQEESQARMLVYGENTIKSKKTFHPVKNFAKQLVNLMAIMLWVASILALISGTPLLSYANLVYHHCQCYFFIYTGK